MIRLSNLNWEDHDGSEILRIRVKDFLEQPMPVDFRTTPAFIPLLLRNRLPNLPIFTTLATLPIGG